MAGDEVLAPVALFSGGIGSWAAAHRLVEAGERPLLLFTDTLIEDEDLYRFLAEAVEQLGLDLVYLADGRTPWELFRDEKMIGNTRADICSRVLKRDLARRWIDDYAPDGCEVVVGMDWTEINRVEKASPHWSPHTLRAPLTDPPYWSKGEMIALARENGLEPPRLYGLGFPHNNCGGFCVKQGHGGFRLLLHTMPQRYADHEAEEEAFRRRTGKDVAILRDRRGGVTRPLTLRALRERDCGQRPLPEELEGGCGCMVE